MADEDQIIETLDENGNLVKFELYDIVEVDEKNTLFCYLLKMKKMMKLFS